MKKYRLIKDFGLFQKGKEFESFRGYIEITNDGTYIDIPTDHIAAFIEQGIIEEVQEPEFTKEDMLDVIYFVISKIMPYASYNNNLEIAQGYIKKYKDYKNATK